MKRLRSTSAGRWWLVWVSGGRKWVLGSSKAVNAACLAVFDPSTNSALSRQPESAKKFHMGLYGPLRLISPTRRETTAILILVRNLAAVFEKNRYLINLGAVPSGLG